MYWFKHNLFNSNLNNFLDSYILLDDSYDWYFSDNSLDDWPVHDLLNLSDNDGLIWNLYDLFNLYNLNGLIFLLNNLFLLDNLLTLIRSLYNLFDLNNPLDFDDVFFVDVLNCFVRFFDNPFNLSEHNSFMNDLFEN